MMLFSTCAQAVERHVERLELVHRIADSEAECQSAT
jgi:hypothetical protein